MFVAIEGSDGAGKATQTGLLVDAFTRYGLACETFAFPAYEQTLGGRLLGELLSGRRGDFVHADPRLASLPYAIDRYESAGAIRRALDGGKAVVTDRYVGSNQIHQGGKVFAETDQISALESYLEWLDELEYGVLRNPKPDLIVYLRVPLETSLQLLLKKRAAKNHGLKDGDLDQVERDRGYLENSIAMADWLAARSARWRAIVCTDTEGNMRSPEAIHEDVWRTVMPLLRR